MPRLVSADIFQLIKVSSRRHGALFLFVFNYRALSNIPIIVWAFVLPQPKVKYIMKQMHICICGAAAAAKVNYTGAEFVN